MYSNYLITVTWLVHLFSISFFLRGSIQVLDEIEHLAQIRDIILSISSADEAIHDDSLGVVVLDEKVEAVDEVGAVEGVAADADAKGLAQADLK